MASLSRVAPCLWFDGRAEEAARFYVDVFPDSRIVGVTRYGEAGREHHGQPPGSVMTIAFELDGQFFTAMNGGPLFRFSQAISFQVMCDTQDEIDRYWARLGEGGDARAQQCGWLKDRFGLSWQVVPSMLPALLASGGDRVMATVLKMKKLEIAPLREAATAWPSEVSRPAGTGAYGCPASRRSPSKATAVVSSDIAT